MMDQIVAKRRGYALLFLGVFISLFMAGITQWFMPDLRSSADTTAAQSNLILILFPLVILFGAIVAAAGAFWARRGQRSRLWTGALLLIFAAIAGLTAYILTGSAGLRSPPAEAHRTY